MPSLRFSYTLNTKKSRGSSKKSPTSGCKDYALKMRGWRNKLRILNRTLSRLRLRATTTTTRLTRANYTPDTIAQRLTGLNKEISRTINHIKRIEAHIKGTP